MDAPKTPAGFDYDYGALPEPEVRAMERHASVVLSIRERQRKSEAEAAVRLGRELVAAQERLSGRGDGAFGRWIVERLGMTPRHARRFIAAFRAFGEDACGHYVPNFEPTALFTLAAASCPEPARAAAVREAEAGKVVTAKRAAELVGKHSPTKAERKGAVETSADAGAADMGPGDMLAAVAKLVIAARAWPDGAEKAATLAQLDGLMRTLSGEIPPTDDPHATTERATQPASEPRETRPETRQAAATTRAGDLFGPSAPDDGTAGGDVAIYHGPTVSDDARKAAALRRRTEELAADVKAFASSAGGKEYGAPVCLSRLRDAYKSLRAKPLVIDESQVAATYQAYPRHVAPEAAKRGIRSVLRNGQVTAADLHAAVCRYAVAVAGADKRIVPHMTTWLSGGRWVDGEVEWRASAQLDSADVMRTAKRSGEFYAALMEGREVA